MFKKNVDHTPYFVTDLDNLVERTGFPFSRLQAESNMDNEPSDSKEQLLMAVNGNAADLLIVTNKKIAVYKIPKKKSFFKKAFGEAVGYIPGVGEVLDGIDNAKDLAGGAKNLSGWVTGKNKREKQRRIEEGMPSKKDFKGVEWDLRKDDGLAMILMYRDDILMANGFGWKSKFEVENNVDQPSQLVLKPNGIDIRSGKKKASIKFSKNDGFTHDLINKNRELFKISKLEIEG